MLILSRKSITLIELLIALSLLAVMVLSINSIGVFSRYHSVSADRRAKIQNELSLSLEHLTKHLSTATGNETLYGDDSAVYISPNSTSTTVLSVFTDANFDGLVDSTNDYWIGYNFNSSTHQLSYCGQCASASCGSCSVTTEYLSEHITAFSAEKKLSAGENYIEVALSACYDPAQTHASCGSADNPDISMSTSVGLPAVAIN